MAALSQLGAQHGPTWHPKWSQNGAKLAPKSHPTSKKQKSWKFAPLLLGPTWCPKGTRISRPERPQNHNNPRNPPHGPLGLQNGPPGLQNYSKSCFWPPKIYKIPLQTACFLHSCFQHFLTTCLPKIVENMTAELKRKLRSGTVAGYARSALDIVVKIIVSLHNNIMMRYSNRIRL